MHAWCLAGVLGMVSVLAWAQPAPLPAGVVQQLPAGLQVFTFLPGDFNADARTDYVVVMRHPQEQEQVDRGADAPRRPLLVFMQQHTGQWQVTARHDELVLALDEGGQCDPFMFSEAGLAVKGAYFTVQHAVACGEHWTDFVTFRYDTGEQQFVFHNRIVQTWVMNTSAKPHADALVPGKRVVTRAMKHRPVRLPDYRLDPR
jgi:hypothetical protein